MKSIIPAERIEQKIYFIRSQKVMLDRDLAGLYEVETAYLKRQVKRNIERFPEDFMFILTKEELKNWRCQFGASNSIKMGLRYSPRVINIPVFSFSPVPERYRVRGAYRQFRKRIYLNSLNLETIN